eukprot:6198115-Pleurochrysis_carterae.AAC.3
MTGASCCARCAGQGQPGRAITRTARLTKRRRRGGSCACCRRPTIARRRLLPGGLELAQQSLRAQRVTCPLARRCGSRPPPFKREAEAPAAQRRLRRRCFR